MNNINEQLEPLFEALDKLVKEINEAKIPASTIVRDFIKKVEQYPYRPRDVNITVYDEYYKYDISMDDCAGIYIYINGSNWNGAGNRSVTVLAHALPKLLEAFIKSLRQTRLIEPKHILFKLPFWKRQLKRANRRI